MTVQCLWHHRDPSVVLLGTGDRRSQHPHFHKQTHFRMICEWECSGPTVRIWEEHLPWEFCLGLRLGAQQTFVVNRELKFFTWVPWLEFKRLVPLRIQCITCRHFFCLHHCPPFTMRVMLHITYHIRLVTCEMIHVLQILCLHNAHCQFVGTKSECPTCPINLTSSRRVSLQMLEVRR